MKSVVFTHLISFPLCSVEKKLRRFACETNGTMYKFFWRESVGVCPPPKFICDVTTYPYARTRTRLPQIPSERVCRADIAKEEALFLGRSYTELIKIYD